MTFGAMAAWQAWLLLAGAAAAATWLFFLKVRPPRIIVSSLTLWRRVLDESRDVSWWERVRRAVSLILVLLTTLALALAIVRPSARPKDARAAGAPAAGSRVLIVIDSSWSMLAATRSGETRWDRAISEARRLAAAAGGDEVAIATTADGVVEEPTSDPALIESALDRIAPAGGAASAWPRIAGARDVHFITDGAVARRLDAGVVVHSVFEPAANVAIAAFEVRRALQADLAGEAYLEVANYSADPQPVHVTLTRGGVPVFDRRVDMAAGEAIREVVPLPRDGGAELHARVDAPHNSLVADDEAVAWMTGGQPVAVTVVSDQPAPFGVLLQRDPGVRVMFAAPASYRPGNEDVVIFDRAVPKDAPAKPGLYFAPPAASWFGDMGPEEKLPRWVAAGPHPVVRGVDPLTLAIARARPYLGADLVPIAKSEQGTALVSVIESSTQRSVVVSFSGVESNLAFAPGFPILVGNAIDWLAHPDAGTARRPGVAEFPSSVTRLLAPNGKAVPLTKIGGTQVGILRTPGLYIEEASGARSVVPVNIGDPETSNLARTTLTATERAASVAPATPQRPWWLYGVWLALAILAGEWWTWQRRVTV